VYILVGNYATFPVRDLRVERRIMYIANYPTNRPIFAELHNELVCNPTAVNGGRGARIVLPLFAGGEG